METRELWHGALRRYLGVIAGGNLVWEFAHMPLYTIWQMGTWSEIIFAALHCTGGDILIALATLMLTLLLLGNSRWPSEQFTPVALTTMALGVGYTAFSEWLNVEVRAAWAYSELMPVLPLFNFHIGVSPLLQWIVVPSLAFWWVRRQMTQTAA